MTPRRFDAIIIGTGQAGSPLAVRLANAGLTVAIIERGRFGGTCVNTGCTPTKTMVASAYAAFLARRSQEFGVFGTGPVRVDLATVKARKDRIVAASRDSVEAWLSGTAGCTVLRGHARFVDVGIVAVGADVLTAPRIFINVGGRAARPAFPGVNDVRLLTSGDLLDLDDVPRHLVVVGGGYVGLEFAQVFRRFGAQVTLVEKGARLAKSEDEDVSVAIRDVLEREGISVRTGADCIRFAARSSNVAVGLTCSDGGSEVVGSHVLLAVGRQPNTDDLGLEVAGVAMDTKGFVTVDDRLETNVPGVYALGECNGRGAFTHSAYNDYEIVAANLLDGAARKVTDRIPCYGLFTDPPLGRVGLTERDARAAGRNVRTAIRQMSRVGRAREKGETLGFMKVIVDGDTDAILGASVFGVGGDEAIHGVLVAMYAGVTASDYTRMVAIHPTVSELIPTVFGDLSS